MKRGDKLCFCIEGGALSHQRSRRAFSSVDANDPLLRLYCELIGLELVLKDHQHQWIGGHDIYTLINGNFDTAIDIFALQLKNDLERLICTDINGNPSQVLLRKYPAIRYLHRDVDKPSGATDAQLNAIHATLSALKQQLNNFGVVP